MTLGGVTASPIRVLPFLVIVLLLAFVQSAWAESFTIFRPFSLHASFTFLATFIANFLLCLRLSRSWLIALAGSFASIASAFIADVVFRGRSDFQDDILLSLTSLLSIVFLDSFLVSVLAGEPKRRTLLSGIIATVKPTLTFVGFVGLSAILQVRTATGMLHALQPIVPAIASCICVPALMTAFSLVFRIREEGIARLNRDRETGERLADRLAFVLIPRWALSICGIGFSALVVGIYGGATEWEMIEVAGGTSLVLAALGSDSYNDWRKVFVLLLAGLVVGTSESWLMEIKSADAAAVRALIGISLALAIVASRTIAVAGDATSRSIRSLERNAFAVTFALPATLVAPIAAFDTARFASFALPIGAIAGLLLVPSLATVLETVIPRRKSVAELYGRRG